MSDMMGSNKGAVQGNSMDIEDLTLEEAEIVAAGLSGAEKLVIGGIIVFGAAIVIL
ncbi:hypothetical protein [Sphingomonas sp. PB1R3]|uniref:hypothetical protein n=1 Tax=Sphingomonas flavida TaxID=3096154 RepID=UPI002FCB4C71